ncbi:MAG: hypothetical protein A2X66_05370 [Ignavibacteria bacterium GWA2_54_16]|nr:MAG: hypothetical protein A2X66_05370 [Ignavibacteria bacterium GWA2_54_16]
MPQRARVQKQFQRAIDAVNKEYKGSISSKFVLTLGDEFQGLLSSPSESFRLVRHFQDLMEDVPFAFGIGVGPLATLLNPREALGMDGECFHRARAALLIAKRQHREIVYDFDSPALSLINAFVGLMDALWGKLTPRQQRIAQLSKISTQEDVAKKLKITQQAVSKVHSSTGIKRLQEAESTLRKYLESIQP